MPFFAISEYTGQEYVVRQGKLRLTLDAIRQRRRREICRFAAHVVQLSATLLAIRMQDIQDGTYSFVLVSIVPKTCSQSAQLDTPRGR